jgi:iron complex transport system permease protein
VKAAAPGKAASSASGAGVQDTAATGPPSAAADAIAAPAGTSPAGAGPVPVPAGPVPAGPSQAAAPPERLPIGRIRPGRALAIAMAALVVAMIVGVSVGPAGISVGTVVDALAARLPWHPAISVPSIDAAIIWQLRLPRVVLGALVGAMLAGGGAAYQGVFRNPLADPYLLGVAAGAGLGATIVIVTGTSPDLLPPAAFAGALGAVALTYLLGVGAGRDGQAQRFGGGTASVLLAGIAVAALLTAAQTYLQQQHSQTLQTIYEWLLGGLSTASWSDVTMIIPYVAVSAIALLAHRRLLDVLRVGETEASSLGVNVARLRLIVVIAATLGCAAAVAVSGLIGFVGIIVPHAVRLTAGASYRIVLPVSMVGGAAFLVLADVAARTVQSPAEVPLGVITAAVGAPFFLFVLRSRRARQDLM